MSFTQSQLDALKAAYASGVKTVQHDGKMVTYRSFTEMERAIERIEASLQAKPRREIRRIGTSKGFR
ncbi:phage head-tail joining protein [Roseovarius sp. SYSU LYC5161]|uniref:phage head-tail joining protein n=1 Tax=Roseovarius halophilus (ex Wu et al. 2025) TaxID=3376060 RepID=UPI00399A5A9E